jgi:hypothetical protein
VTARLPCGHQLCGKGELSGRTLHHSRAYLFVLTRRFVLFDAHADLVETLEHLIDSAVSAASYHRNRFLDAVLRNRRSGSNHGSVFPNHETAQMAVSFANSEDVEDVLTPAPPVVWLITTGIKGEPRCSSAAFDEGHLLI